MPDSIDNAVAKSNGTTPEEEETKTPTRKGALPPNKDQLVEKQRPKAKAHADKTESDRNTLFIKENDTPVEALKKEYTPMPLKVPKFKKFLELCTNINKVAKERTATSKENIQKGKELFTYPLKGGAAASSPTTAPDIPQNS